MSQTIHVVFPCQEGKGAELLGILTEALVDTRAFEGCESIEAYSNSDHPDTVVLWEKFATRANHEAYLAWRIENGMLEMLGPILASDLEVTYYDDHPDV
ncbi:MAG: antibiotic biosynthesis monooxygenase [Acidimicrobiales bacterium]|jgi:quinol monooxygenase YgiN|nr:antibiotic biosynthesis monooxygenase [Acidimicrobiaceae bacterium]MDP6492251.1 antibiotic biosynthesis monooxygenase [Acidimicrobiales bacterium]MDP6649302.1 antibiotic biosynthesis monooxygenase [Acidimicrobiales bacterium]MDP6759356.1 antibiotic biosynthesis monooxygenase [Acidimicrobiales bacterium]|tara:strand:- start:269 stop:565 length:297 start_codon:yes stop_codon:yes gene_type:complete